MSTPTTAQTAKVIRFPLERRGMHGYRMAQREAIREADALLADIEAAARENEAIQAELARLLAWDGARAWLAPELVQS